MSRSQRQVDELRGLCDRGSVSRAIDLAFLHFADFGRNEDVLEAIAGAIELERTTVPAAVRRRFLDLRSAAGQRPGAQSSTPPPTTAPRRGAPHVQ
jgi:hypothetical protein